MKFRKFNSNPSGNVTTDALVRTVAGVLNITWEDAMMKLAESACKHHLMITDRKFVSKFMKEQGWTKIKMNNKSIKSLKISQPAFIRCHKGQIPYITFYDGESLVDIFDCSMFKMDYIYIKSVEK